MSPRNHLEEGVLPHLSDCDPLTGLFVEHLLQQVSCISRYHARDLELGLLDAFVKLLDVVSVERWHANKHFIQNSAHLVDVSWLTNS